MGKRNSIKPKYIAFIFFTTHFKEEDKTKQKNIKKLISICIQKYIDIGSSIHSYIN